jgi:hypothetical protein
MRDQCRLTGNPVRTSLTLPTREEARAHFGLEQATAGRLHDGWQSLGSQAMNEAMASAYQLLLHGADTAVIWQTGDRYFDRYKASFEEHPICVCCAM